MQTDATDRQIAAIYAIGIARGIPACDIDACLADYDDLTVAQASGLIDHITAHGDLPPSPYAPASTPARDAYLMRARYARQRAAEIGLVTP